MYAIVEADQLRLDNTFREALQENFSTLYEAHDYLINQYVDILFHHFELPGRWFYMLNETNLVCIVWY